MPRSAKIFIDVTHTDLIRSDVFPCILRFIEDIKEDSVPIDFYFFADAGTDIPVGTIQQFTQQLLNNFQKLFTQDNVKINFNSVVATPFDLIIARIKSEKLQNISAQFEQDPVCAANQDYTFIRRFSRTPLTSFGNHVVPAQKNTLQFLLRELYRLPFAKDILPLGLLYAATMFNDSNCSTLVISENLAVLDSCLKAKFKLLQDQQITLQLFYLGRTIEHFGENDRLRIQTNASAELDYLIEKVISLEDRSFYSIGGSRRELIARFGLPAYSGSTAAESFEAFENDVTRNRLVIKTDDDATQWLAKMKKLAITASDYSQGVLTGSSDVSLLWNRMTLGFIDSTYFALNLKASSTFFSFLDQQKNPTGISIWKWHEDIWMMAIVRYRDEAKCFSDAEVKMIFNAPCKALMDRLLGHQTPNCSVVTSHEMFMKNISSEVNSEPHMDLLKGQFFPRTESIALFGLDRSICDFLVAQNNGPGVIQIRDIGINFNHFSQELVSAIKSNNQQRPLSELVATVSIVDPACHFQDQQLVMEIEQRILLLKFLLDIKNNSLIYPLKPNLSGIAPSNATFIANQFKALDHAQQVAVLKELRKKIQTFIDYASDHTIQEKFSILFKSCSEAYFKAVHPVASSLGRSMKSWLTIRSKGYAENISLQVPQTTIESPATNATTPTPTGE